MSGARGAPHPGKDMICTSGDAPSGAKSQRSKHRKPLTVEKWKRLGERYTSHVMFRWFVSAWYDGYAMKIHIVEVGQSHETTI